MFTYIDQADNKPAIQAVRIYNKNSVPKGYQMPIYEYLCEECKGHFEVLIITSSEPETIQCKKCGSSKVKKTVSAGSFRMSSGGASLPAGSPSGCSCKSGFS